MTTSSIAKGTLEGIVSYACKLADVDRRRYRVKIGGDQLGHRAAIDWYASVQNVNASVNTEKARKLSLIRTTFGIRQVSDRDPLKLVVREWSEVKDWQEGYRLLWEADSDDMQARLEMSRMMADAINRSRPKTSKA